MWNGSPYGTEGPDQSSGGWVVWGEFFTPDWSKVVKTHQLSSRRPHSGASPSCCSKSTWQFCISDQWRRVDMMRHLGIIISFMETQKAEQTHLLYFSSRLQSISSNRCLPDTDKARMWWWVTFILRQQWLVKLGGVALLTEFQWFSCGLVDTASTINNSPEMRSNSTWKLNSGCHTCTQLWLCPNSDNKSVRIKLTAFGKLASVII